MEKNKLLPVLIVMLIVAGVGGFYSGQATSSPQTVTTVKTQTATFTETLTYPPITETKTLTETQTKYLTETRTHTAYLTHTQTVTERLTKTLTKTQTKTLIKTLETPPKIDFVTTGSDWRGFGDYDEQKTFEESYRIYFYVIVRLSQIDPGKPYQFKGEIYILHEGEVVRKRGFKWSGTMVSYASQLEGAIPVTLLNANDGEYKVIVTVTDLIAGRSNSKTTTFIITPSKTPAMVQVEIEPTHNGYIDPAWDVYRVVGVAVNKGDIAVTDIKITAKFYDSFKRLIAVDSYTICYDYPYAITLPPNRKAPFQLEIRDKEIAKLISSYSLSVTASPASISKPESLKITEANIVIAEVNEYYKYKTWRVVGTVKNEGNIEATNTHVIGALYNQNGMVVGTVGLNYWSDYQPGNIPPGEERSFFLKCGYIPIAEEVTAAVLFIESYQSTGFAYLDS